MIVKLRYIRAGWIFVGLMLAGCGVNAAERNNAANWYTAQGQYQDAVSAYQAAQVAEPDNPQLYFNAAEALARDGDLEAAMQTLQQAMERGDDTLKAQALYNLGGIFIDQDMYQEAVDAYRQVLLIQPDYAEARHNLEVAMLYLTRPTPTALEQKIQPDQQNADTSATPTPATAALEQPTPTPTPPPQGIPEGPTPSGGEVGEQETGENQGTPQPDKDGDLNAEEA